MKVFISWSGDLSEKIARVIRDWLPAVLQAVKPFFTPNDIDKGARWASEIAGELKASNVRIFVITPENVERPWIMFEAGAIARDIDSSKVCILLFGLENTDLKGPLTQFQATKFEKEDFRKFVYNINNSLDLAKLDNIIISEVFDLWWPKLEANLQSIIQHSQQSISKQPSRNQKDILEEVLDLTRSIQKQIAQNNQAPSSAYYSISYENSSYKLFIDALKDVCLGVDYSNDSLDIIEPSIEFLINEVRNRRLATNLRQKIFDNLKEIADALKNERERNDII